MAISIPDFWKLLVDSRLLNAQQCQHLAAKFGKAAPAAQQAGAKPLAQWLVQQNVISRYQAGILLSGRPGPFQYGDYKIYDRIEKGRLRRAFRAVHAATNHPVLLHFLTGAAAQDNSRWAQLAALPRITHPQVARCWEAVDLGSYKFLVWEDLRGGSLADVLESKGPLPPAEACRVVWMAASGLAQLHQAGRAHGDLRPHNIWLDSQGNVKLLVAPEIDLSPPDLAQGDADEELQRRADYFAPEFAQAGKAPDALTDIYGLGCSLYESIAGRPPFAGGTVAQKMHRHATEAIQPLPAAGGGDALGKVVAYMMAKNPAVRFQQVSAVLAQLEPFAKQSKTQAAPAAPRPTQPAYEKWLAQHRSQPAPAAPDRPPASGIGVASPGSGIGIAAGGSGIGPPGPQTAAANPAVAPIQVQQRAPRRKPSRPTAGKAGKSGILAQQMARARAKRRQNTVILASGLVVAALVIAGVLYALNNMEGTREPGQPPRFAGPAQVEVVTNSDPQPPGGHTPEAPASEDLGGEAVAAPGDLLWASPTSGPPIQLDDLPGGAQVFLVARPAEIMSQEEGRRVLTALGPDFATARSQWESTAGFALDEIEQLVVGLYGNSGNFPRVSCVVRLADEISAEDLLARWGSPSQRTAGEATYYAAGEWCYFIPGSAAGRAFVMGHEEQIKDVAQTGGGPPLLRREIGRLLRVSDQQRHFTILFAPNFLFSDGRALFSGERAKVLDPLERFLGDGLKAGMVSMQLGQPLYFEMRMESDIVIDRFTLASNFRNRLAEVPDAIEAYIAALNPHPYWRRVAFRYPTMVRFLHRQTRVGVEGSHAMINAALPEPAAHNLVFGGEMVLASAPGNLAVTPTGGAPAGPRTIEEVLTAKMTISFDQDSLEFSMRNVETEVQSMFKSLPFEFKILILGDDLKLDGITRNQQIRDFNQQNRTVAEVLTAMVMKANPVTTVKEPSERDQKLLWVIAPDPESPDNRIILVTTRQVAEQKYTLPEVFRAS